MSKYEFLRGDIVINDLNPTEDYKSSILAGLSPSVIMDIASRALSFHVYQLSQEALFKDMTNKSLSEQVMSYERQVQTFQRETSQKENAYVDKIASLESDYQLEKKRIGELSEQLHERNRQFQKLMVNYEKLKRRTMLMQTTNQHGANAGPTPSPSHHQPNTVLAPIPTPSPSRGHGNAGTMNNITTMQGQGQGQAVNSQQSFQTHQRIMYRQQQQQQQVSANRVPTPPGNTNDYSICSENMAPIHTHPHSHSHPMPIPMNMPHRPTPLRAGHMNVGGATGQTMNVNAAGGARRKYLYFYFISI